MPKQDKIFAEKGEESKVAKFSKEERAEAIKQNNVAYRNLLDACLDSMSFGIVNLCRTNLEGKVDAFKAWEKLSNCFKPKTWASKVQIKAKFTKCHPMSSQIDPDEWIVKLEQIC